MRKKTKKKEKPTKSEVKKKDTGLYNVLKRRGLLDKVCTSRSSRWRGMSNTELIEYAKKLIKDEGIKSSKELQMAEPALERALRSRNLTGEVGLQKPKRRDWSKMSDDQIVAHAQEVIRKHGLTTRQGLTQD